MSLAPTRRLPTVAVARAVFALGGLAFYLIGALLVGDERPVVVVKVRAEAGPEEIEDRVAEALLVEAGIDAGFIATDPLIRGQLVRGLRFAAGDDEDAPLTPEEAAQAFEQALALGLHRADPVVRARLVTRMAAISDRPLHAPDEGGLAALFTEELSSLMLPEAVDFSHLFFSAARRGAAARIEALHRLASLRGDGSGPEAAEGAAGDPLPLLGPRAHWTTSQTRRRLGAAFADGLAAAPEGAWSGPLTSPYGEHLVWVRARRPATAPTLEEVRGALTARWRDRQSREALARRVAALRDHYLVRLERFP